MTHYMFGMYGMRYFRELINLYAYDFQFMFQILPDRRGRARGDHIARTMISVLFEFDVVE